MNRAMSIQEMKSQIHRLVDTVEDESTLEEVSRILSGEYNIPKELTDAQIVGLEKARQEVREGKGMPLAEFKLKMEKKWPALKSQ